jgi:cytochrome P450
MSLGEQVMSRAVEPALLRVCQWRGDPVARLMLPATAADPYPLYARVRQRGLVRSPLGVFIAADHATVASVLRDRRFSSSPAHQKGYRPPSYPPDDPRADLPAAEMLFLDPPDHTRLRGLVNKAFSPRVLAAIRPRIAEIIDELLEPVAGRASMDVIADLSLPLPAIVIAELLGVPVDDRERFLAWSDAFGALLDDVGTGGPGVEVLLRGVAEFLDYFRGLIGRRRSRPRDDLLQGLIEARERGDALSEEELLGNCVLILAAGHVTTTHLIGNGLLALLQHPDQLGRLRADPSLAPPAVAELLRYDPPVQVTGRVVVADAEIGGEVLRAGDRVALCLAAANHDPERFPDPERLDIERAERRHLAFGHGIHFCLGAPLARIEAEIAFTTLIGRFPAMRLQTEAVEREVGVVFRGLRRLPLALA